MAVKPFKKIEIIGLKTDKTKLISSLKRLGLVQITNLQSNNAINITHYDEILDKLNRIYDNLKPISEKPENPFIGERVITADYEKDVLKENELSDLYEKIRKHLNNMRERSTNIHTLEHKILKLQIVKDLEVPLGKIEDSPFTKKRIMIIPYGQLENFNEIIKNTSNLYAKKITQVKNQISFLIIYPTIMEEELVEKFSKIDKEPYEITGEPYAPKPLIEKYEEEIENNSQGLENEKDILGKYLKYYNRVKISIDYYKNELEKITIGNNLETTEKTFYIEGWVPRDKMNKVDEYLKKTNILYVNFREPLKNEKVPIEYKNAPFINFYESITDMYDRPNYSELDPTPLISLFFTFFFGFCLTDAGYGLIIVIFMSFIIFNKKTKRILGNSIKIFYVFFFSGIAAMFMGAITGGFFGITLPQAVAKYVPINLSIDNLNNSAIPFLKFAIYLGAIHVAFGFLLNMIKEIKRKNIFMGIMQNLPNLIIIYSSIKLTASLIGAEVNTPLWLTLFGISMILNVIFSAPESKGIKRILKGAYNAFFGFTGLMGDILSYMRLFALGLATGILIFVINTVAGILIDLLGIPGYIFAVLLLIVGHIINILLNSLGAFVHSLRLQFVEFFQKFFEGGGKPYSPLRETFKFTIIEERKEK
ncbi:hypothetical protein J7L48_08490 [bacterium]|nr:hypothetical protein [bacterium]